MFHKINFLQKSLFASITYFTLFTSAFWIKNVPSGFIFENSMFHVPPFRPVSAHRCCAFCCAVIPHQAIVFSSGSWSVRTRRHSRGVMPFSRLNIAAKRLGLSYPTRCAISKMLKSVVKSSCSACCTRQRRR